MERGSRQWRAEEDGRIEIAVKGKHRQQNEVAKEDSQRWVSIPCGFIEVLCPIHAHDSLQMHEKLYKIVTHKLPFLFLELTQVHIVRLFFLPRLSVVFFCGRKEMGNTPAETTWWISGHE